MLSVQTEAFDAAVASLPARAASVDGGLSADDALSDETGHRVSDFDGKTRRCATEERETTGLSDKKRSLSGKKKDAGTSFFSIAPKEEEDDGAKKRTMTTTTASQRRETHRMYMVPEKNVDESVEVARFVFETLVVNDDCAVGYGTIGAKKAIRVGEIRATVETLTDLRDGMRFGDPAAKMRGVAVTLTTSSGCPFLAKVDSGAAWCDGEMKKIDVYAPIGDSILLTRRK
jgi:hypothetical protein